MKHNVLNTILLATLCRASSAIWASTLYVDGVSGSDNNNCPSPTTACNLLTLAPPFRRCSRPCLRGTVVFYHAWHQLPSLLAHG